MLTAMIGQAASPTGLIVPQTMMDVPLYSGFWVRLALLILLSIVGTVYAWRYCLKIRKDPSKSLMGNTDWLAHCEEVPEESAIKAVSFDFRAALTTLIFFAQYIVIVICCTGFQMNTSVQIAIQLIVVVLCGCINRMKMDEVGNAFAKGTSGMAFVCFVIGLASTMSLVMTQGNILHTIVYYISAPLRNLDTGLATVGLSVIITLINIIIPSQSAKAAIMMPIVKPMCESLGITAQVGVLAFQIGDGLTNTISPFLGALVAALAMANLPYNKWFRWVFPIVCILLVVGWAALFFLGRIGWTGL